VQSTRDRGPVIPRVAGAQQGLNGGGLRAGVQHGWVAGIPVVVDLATWTRGGYLVWCVSG
jgi:hypothetical protein